MQMVGIGEFYLAADFFQIHRRNRSFNCTGCPYIHKYRRFHGTMYRFQAGSFGPSICSQYLIHSIQAPFCEINAHSVYLFYYGIAINFSKGLDKSDMLFYNKFSCLETLNFLIRFTKPHKY